MFFLAAFAVLGLSDKFVWAIRGAVEYYFKQAVDRFHA